jgi:hypothetical protein
MAKNTRYFTDILDSISNNVVIEEAISVFVYLFWLHLTMVSIPQTM